MTKDDWMKSDINERVCELCGIETECCECLTKHGPMMYCYLCRICSEKSIPGQIMYVAHHLTSSLSNACLVARYCAEKENTALKQEIQFLKSYLQFRDRLYAVIIFLLAATGWITAILIQIYK